jgi:hypothetical protein
MSASDWIATSLTIFGFGFSLWAFMLKKTIDSFNHLSDILTHMDKRLAAMEQWAKFKDEEISIYRARAVI